MENLFPEKVFKEVQFSIFGKHFQSLNIILMPLQEIMTYDQCVIVMTPGLYMNQLKSFFDPLISKLSIDSRQTPMSHSIQNASYEFGNIVLNNNGGKIMAFNMTEFESMRFDSKYLFTFPRFL